MYIVTNKSGLSSPDKTVEMVVNREELKSFKDKKKSLIRRGASKIKSIIKGLYESN